MPLLAPFLPLIQLLAFHRRILARLSVKLVGIVGDAFVVLALIRLGCDGIENVVKKLAITFDSPIRVPFLRRSVGRTVLERRFFDQLSSTRVPCPYDAIDLPVLVDRSAESVLSSDLWLCLADPGF
jgi:hypothetical protein